ncbi:MAG: hypothetical protein N2578_01955 [Bdellovibrionaceae bacterium]|nr:hypothetical protein [Pseudobdellovibrionaceae bacterium]
MRKNLITFGFDLGAGSIAGAICENGKIIHLDSVTFPEDLGSRKAARDVRRRYRTRMAHRAREYHWWQIAKEAGIPVPFKYNEERLKKGDYRIEIDDPEAFRRFRSQTVPSVALRIKLLEGESLTGEEIFKAIHNAIQRRGYTENVPWLAEIGDETKPIRDLNEKKKSSKDAKEFAEKRSLYQSKISEFPEKFRLPCYVYASLMGIWTKEEGLNLSIFSESTSSSERKASNKIVAAREDVLKELRMLLEKARQKYPKLDIDRALGLEPNEKIKKGKPGYEDVLRYYQGHKSLLGQKFPKFENRAVGSCRVIPRFKVAKKNCPEFVEFYYLQSFKNLSVQNTASEKVSLSAEQVVHLMQKFKDKICLGDDEGTRKNITKTDLELELNNLGLIPIKVNTIEPPPGSGRCAYSKPALRFLNRIYRGEVLPAEAYKTFIREPSRQDGPAIAENMDPQKGLVPDDLQIFKLMEDLNISYENLYIPQPPAKLTAEEFIRNVPSPIVQVRLYKLLRLLRDFKKKVGGAEKVDRVVVEIVREDNSPLLSAKALEYMKKQKELKSSALAKVKEAKLSGEKMLKKMRLWEEQNGICLYTGAPLEINHLADYEIDHIVPRSFNGGNQWENLVLTHSETNRTQKGDRTPYQWLGSDPQRWREFNMRVRKNGNISKKKATILLSNEIPDIALSQRPLSVTAYAEKLAQRLVYIEMGWPLPFESNMIDTEQRVWVVPGTITASLGKKLRRSEILLNRREAENKDSNKKSEKERKDPRHHAFDASVCALLPHFFTVSHVQKSRAFPDLFEITPPSDFDVETNLAQPIKAHVPVDIPKSSTVSENFLNPREVYHPESGMKRRPKMVSSEYVVEIPARTSGNVCLTGIQLTESKGANRGFVVLKTQKKSRNHYVAVVWKPFQSYQDFLEAIRKVGGTLVTKSLLGAGQVLRIQGHPEIPDGEYRIETLKSGVQLKFYDVKRTVNINPLFSQGQVEVVRPDSVFFRERRIKI